MGEGGRGELLWGADHQLTIWRKKSQRWKIQLLLSHTKYVDEQLNSLFNNDIIKQRI